MYGSTKFKTETISYKDLQLRIINESLTYNREFTCNTCCLCCRDLVTRLSKDERVIKLIYGFIRTHTKYNVPSVILQLFMDYVGTANEFKHHQLQSNKEYRKQKCYFWIEDCQYNIDDCCGKHLRNFVDYSVCPFCNGCFPIIFLIVCVIIIYGKDIALLIIYGLNMCDNTLINDKLFIALQSNQWITIGCISHLAIWCSCSVQLHRNCLLDINVLFFYIMDSDWIFHHK
eukprot:15530_1